MNQQQQKENLPVPQCQIVILRYCNGIGGNGADTLTIKSHTNEKNKNNSNFLHSPIDCYGNECLVLYSCEFYLFLNQKTLKP